MTLDLLTYEDIARETGVPVERLYVWRHRGKLPKPTVDNHQPLWARDEVTEWIQQNSTTKLTN